MKKINISAIVFLIMMILFSFSSITNINIDGQTVKLAGLTIVFGILGFFINNKKTDGKMEGLRIKEFIGTIKNIKVLILILIPIVLDIETFMIEKSVFPDVLQHIRNRTDFVNTSQIVVTFIELAIAALGEEIAWRAFFQKQLSNVISFIPSIIITSLLFTICHFNIDTPLVVAIDLGEIFINSIVYGLIFRKTNNAWCSWLSHYIANVIAMMMIIFML